MHTIESIKLRILGLYGANVKVLTKKYVASEQLKLRCSCGKVWKTFFKNIAYSKRSVGCPACSREAKDTRATRSNRDYLAKLSTVTDRIIPKESYINSSTAIKHLCLECNTELYLAPKNTLAGHGCSSCSKKHTEVSFLAALHGRYGTDLQLVGKYRRVPRLRFKCYKCLHTFKAPRETILYRSVGCPCCVASIRVKNGQKWAKVKTVIKNGVELRLQGFEPQALDWILSRFPKLKVSDFIFDSSGQTPRIKYNVGRRTHTYFPDMYLPKQNRIIEVKSDYTLGLNTGKHWRKNQEKAIACLEQGYKFTMLVMTAGGKRIRLPTKWYLKSRQKVLTEMKQGRYNDK